MNSSCLFAWNSSLWQKAYASNLFLDNMPPFMHTFLNWPTYFSCIRNVVGLHGWMYHLFDRSLPQYNIGLSVTPPWLQPYLPRHQPCLYEAPTSCFISSRYIWLYLRLPMSSSTSLVNIHLVFIVVSTLRHQWQPYSSHESVSTALHGTQTIFPRSLHEGFNQGLQECHQDQLLHCFNKKSTRVCPKNAASIVFFKYSLLL